VTQIICGVDVGSETLDARVGQDGAWKQFARSAEGSAALAGFCKTHAVDLVVMEATGGYERLPFAQLWEAGQPVAVVNPRSVRKFAEAMGRLEKTDRIDCGMIAWYAETKRIKAMEPASANQQRLTALVVRLRQLTEAKVVQLNQRRLVTEPDAVASFEPILAAIAGQIRSLETKIAEAIDDDPLWAEFNRVFRTIKGWPTAASRAWRPKCRRLGPCPARPSPSLSASRRWRATAASRLASVQYAADPPACDPSCSWWPRSFDGMIQTSWLSIKGCAMPESPKRWSASPSPINCWSVSMRKHAMREKILPLQLDKPDSRSAPPLAG